MLTDKLYVEHVTNWAFTKMQDVSTSSTSDRSQFWLNPDFDAPTWLYNQPGAKEMMESGTADVYAVFYKYFPALWRLTPAQAAPYWKKGRKIRDKNYVVSKYSMLMDLFWLPNPDKPVWTPDGKPHLPSEMGPLDDQIHDLDRRVRAAKKVAHLAGMKTTPEIDKMKSDRSAFEAQREDLRASVVDKFIEEYNEDPTHSFNRLMSDLIDTMLGTDVPKPLNDEHRFEYEDDDAYPRILELSLRIARVREMIQKLYGTNVRFVPNKPDWAYKKYQDANKNQRRDFADDAQWLKDDVGAKLKYDEALVTFNYDQINLWNDQMIRFTFPLVAPALTEPGKNLIDTLIDGFMTQESADDSDTPDINAEKPLKFKPSVKAAGHLVHTIFENEGGKITKAYQEAKALMDTAQKDYLETHALIPINATAKIKNPTILKSLVGKDFKISDAQIKFIDDGTSFNSDPTSWATGMLREASGPRIRTAPQAQTGPMRKLP
jgi:hypothetical protein